MPILKQIEPLYQHYKNGTVRKAGYRQIKLITGPNGEILKTEILKTKIYK